MSTSQLREQLQQDLSGVFPTSGFPYSKAAVLALCWLEDDFEPPCEEEVRRIQQLFSQKFSYDTVAFRIPSLNSRNALEKAVVDFKFANDSDNTLMIVYYSGHGDPDIERGKAVWAAQQQGGPTVDWFEIQRYLENAVADVLLIFDCCHASLATKARAKGRLEILAATSAREKTPCPGPHSFTSYLAEELEAAISDKGSIQVSDLHTKINLRTKVTPIHFNMRSDPRQSIILRPITRTRRNSTPLGALTFTVSVAEAPNRHSIRQLGEWMKNTAPNTVFAITVDRIVDLSTNIQSFLLDEGRAEVEGRLIDSLPPTQKGALLAELRKLESDMFDKSKLSGSLSISSSEIWPSVTTSAVADPRLGSSIFSRLEDSVHRILQSTWNAISKHPAFSNDIGLEKLTQNEAAQRTGLSTAAELTLAQGRTYTLESEATYIPCENIMHRKIMKYEDRFSIASIENQSIIVEIIRNSSDPDGTRAEGVNAQFVKTSSLLAQPKPEYYRILRCIGFTHDADEEDGWQGLIFELPQGCSSYSTLDEQFTKTPHLPLEQRYNLAYCIAFSISMLHDVKWVHKGIRSENVVFFGRKGDRSVSFDQPWLFGFESSKEEAADSNKPADYRMHRLVYLPPPRWGKPSEKFTYEHDVYALGVLLLEIGFWLNVLRLDDKNFMDVRSPEIARERLLSAARDLPHVMGSKYAQVVVTCLTTKYTSDANRSAIFRKDVLDVLWELLD